MGNPKVAMRAELEAKIKAKYEQKLKEAIKETKEEFARQLAEAHANYLKMLDMCLQTSADAALMAADDTFDVNAYSAEKFHVAHIDYVNNICKLTIEDSEADPDIEYTKEDVDRRLLQIVGKDNFADWNTRYGGKK